MGLRSQAAEFGWLNIATLPAFAVMVAWYLVDRNPLFVSLAALLLLAGFVADRLE